MSSVLDSLREAADVAQTALAQAEIALIEATASATTLREEASRLNAAVAALSGETPAEPPAQPASSVPESRPEPAGDIHEMTPEEFDAQRKKRQRQREKEEQANNPLAGVPCGGCGTKGSLQESFIQAPSGATLKMLVCGKCNNQIMA